MPIGLVNFGDLPIGTPDRPSSAQTGHPDTGRLARYRHKKAPPGGAGLNHGKHWRKHAPSCIKGCNVTGLRPG